MSTRTVFIYLPEEQNHATAAEALEHMLRFYLLRRDVAHSSRDFWDDEAGFAEYGVRLDMSVSDDDYFLRLLGGIVYLTSLTYGSIRIQLDANCITT